MKLSEACVAEAFAIIGERGVEGLSIREVARRLGVSHQAPYKHFESSDHLLAEVVRRSYASFSAYLRQRVEEPAKGDDAGHDELGRLGMAYLAYALQHPLEYRLMFGTPLPDAQKHPGMLAEARAAFLMLLQALGRKTGQWSAEVAGATPAPGKALQLDALFVWATVHGLATILQTAALSDLGLTEVVKAEAIPHTLRHIGNALLMAGDGRA